MKMCQHSRVADGSDRYLGKAPSRYRHGAECRGFIVSVMYCRERERSQGLAREAGAVYVHAEGGKDK